MSVGEFSTLDVTYVATGSISRYSVVVADSTIDKGCKLPAASGAVAILGVIQEDALASGDVVRVRKLGVTKVIAGMALSVADQVHIHNSSGRVGKPASWSDGTGVVGQMEDSATASGDIIDCFLQIATVR